MDTANPNSVSLWQWLSEPVEVTWRQIAVGAITVFLVTCAIGLVVLAVLPPA